MQTDLTKLDPDVATLLPTGATVGEKLYATAIDDGRTMHVERMPVEQKKAAALETQAQAASVMAQEFANQAKELLSGPNELFVMCARVGVEIRKQSMTTTTYRDTVMKDVVQDGLWIGYQMYNLIAREVGYPQKAVPTDI